MNHHHNTTHETGATLAQFERQAKTQEEELLAIFRYAGRPMTPSEAWKYFPTWPITSVRRAMTNLTSRGELERTEIKRTGPYGRPEYVWVLPRPQGELAL